jgi:hypothetical protein
MLYRLSAHTFIWTSHEAPPLPLFAQWSTWDTHQGGYVSITSLNLGLFWLVFIKAVPTLVKLKRLGLSPL